MGGGGKHIEEQVFPFDTPNFKKILKMMRWPWCHFTESSSLKILRSAIKCFWKTIAEGQEFSHLSIKWKKEKKKTNWYLKHRNINIFLVYMVHKSKSRILHMSLLTAFYYLRFLVFMQQQQMTQAAFQWSNHICFSITLLPNRNITLPYFSSFQY